MLTLGSWWVLWCGSNEWRLLKESNLSSDPVVCYFVWSLFLTQRERERVCVYWQRNLMLSLVSTSAMITALSQFLTSVDFSLFRPSCLTWEMCSLSSSLDLDLMSWVWVCVLLFWKALSRFTCSCILTLAQPYNSQYCSQYDFLR